MSHRIAQVNELIREVFSELLRTEISLKQGVLVTVAKVDTAPDLRTTKIALSVYPESEERYVQVTVANELKRLQRALHARLTMKIKPKIRFVIDTTEQGADVVEKLLKEIENGA